MPQEALLSVTSLGNCKPCICTPFCLAGAVSGFEVRRSVRKIGALQLLCTLAVLAVAAIRVPALLIRLSILNLEDERLSFDERAL